MSEVGLKLFEHWISSGFSEIVGEPALLGLLVIIFFGGFVLLQGQRLDGKILVFVPAFLLASAFLPIWVTIVMLLVCGVILYFALSRLQNH